MQRVSDKVLQWLYNSLKPQYSDVDRTYSDVAKTLAEHSSLSPRTDVYTFDNGTSALLLVLQGTLAVPFRGATYRFPLAMWIPYAYPHEPPMIYVTPTTAMAVRPGQHVSIEGRIYHPYLANWRDHWKVSNLLDMLYILRDAFAKEPPVLSREPQSPSQPKAPVQNSSTGIQPPPSDLTFGSRHGSAPMPAQQSKPPPPPPKPPEVTETSAPSGLNSQVGNESKDRPRPPLLPPKPLQANGHPPHHHSASPMAYPSNSHHASPMDRRALGVADHHGLSPTRGNTSPTHPIIDPRQRAFVSSASSDTQRQVQLNQTPRAASESFATYGAHQLPVQYVTQPQPPPQPSSHSIASASQSFPMEARKPIEDLLSGPVEAAPQQASSNTRQPAPPIPPNPEKDAIVQAISSVLSSQLSQTLTQNNAAIPALEAQHVAMQQAYQNMQNELSQLQQLDEMLASNEKILHEAMREADRVMESVGRREVPKVDDVLVAPTVVGEQLYGLVADVRGISDAMFALTRALDKGRIGGDVFIKQTRTLARERFFKEALIKKIARGMGLATEDI